MPPPRTLARRICSRVSPKRGEGTPPTSVCSGLQCGRVLRSTPREAGFALLIVVTLLAFITLLLLGLAVFTKIETSVAGNMQRQGQARENALLALNVALGQLQAHAGPDKRVTATAEALSPRAGTSRYVGVWPSDPADDPDSDPLTPLTWLVSGNELLDAQGAKQPLAVTPATVTTVLNGVALVSTNTSGTANDVLARLVPITATGVPGVTPGTAATIGRYAWWVGDQGVKAPVAVADTSSGVTYAPFGDGTQQTDLGRRIRQQIALGAGAANASGAPVFEPRDTNNASLVADPNRNPKVTAFNQLAFLRNASNAQLGIAAVRPNFHAWSPNNFAVIADTKNGGLRQDLSLKPELLGAGFTAWANYDPAKGGYMEDPTNPAASAPIPAYGLDPLRRRYLMQAAQTADGAVRSVAPVLSYFLLAFNVRTVGGSTASVAQLQLRARWMVSLWNPYTSALVPEEKLRLDITGLPSNVTVDDEETPRRVVANIALDRAFGSPLSIGLPWTADTTPDRASWLPGRVYTWVSKQNLTGELPDANGYDSEFYTRSLDSSGGQGVQMPVPGVTVDGDHSSDLHVRVPQTLRIKLIAVRPDGEVTLGSFTSPQFEAFVTSPQAFSAGTYQFAYVFRLGESMDGGTWLTNDAVDPHRGAVGAEGFVYQATEANPENPASFAGFKTISAPDRLLDRQSDGFSYNEDTPVFELPRAPLLSVGSMQHLALEGRRPFSIGNSWAGASQLNGVKTTELFDRFFFSGLVTGVVPRTASNGDLVLPNPLLKPLRKADGQKLTIQDIRDFASPPPVTDADGNLSPGPPGSAHSSKFLLQGGAFNLNSVNAAAWAAILRGVRFPAPQSFTYLAADPTTGTAADEAINSEQSTEARFFRFAQSAQETYQAEPGVAGGSDPSAANTHLFRRGARSLTAGQVAQLASGITTAIKARHAEAGPFLSLEQFLAPTTADAPSLLEQAILDAGINADIAEFSSQWLTQADIMTALAPVLFPRSDTFVIRAYGEAVNPATTNTEGRAWCEALVQRVPEYVDPSAATGDAAEVLSADLVSDLNKSLGRRFKVVSFRWLSRSDI